MSPLQVGDQAPEFSSHDQSGVSRSLSDYSGTKLVLYFYPKDNTPGCTTQACNLTENFSELTKHGIKILGVSPDSEAKHLKFIAKFDIAFDLLADEDKSVHKAFGVWGEKKFMGKVFDGTHRTTFLIDENGKIVTIISKPNCKDHAAEVLAGFGI
ncbi:MAG: thioredoxin-dependent thiol peroxidase [Bacteroidetes bacterium]|nr:MAG: thioredoxin-dependent thiol peroxidase [Bacteroidota bacterium]